MTEDDVELYDEETNPITPFTFGIQQAPEIFKQVSLTESMQKAIKDALADVPADKTIAFVVSATQEGIETHFAARVASHWQIAAVAQRPWKTDEPGIFGGVTVFAQVKGTW